MTSENPGPAVLAERPAPAGPAPLSYWQEPMWLTDQMRGSRMMSAPVVCARLRGPVDLPALAAALRGIHRRHDALRTRFDLVDGEPVQLGDDRAEPDHAVVPLPAADRRAVEEACAAEVRRGFDLRTDLPLRSRLYRLGQDDHVLLVVRHHIVGDSRSDRVFVDELVSGYAAALRGEEPRLPRLPHRYVDLARRQRERAAGGRLDRMLADRLDRLRNAPRSVALPLARPAGRVPGDGRSFVVDVPAALAEAVTAHARQCRVSPFMLLLAVFRLALWQYTGQRDAVVATPVEVRTQPGSQDLIGCFLNTLLLPGDLSGTPTVAELIGRERDGTLDAFAHQELPYPLLSRALGADAPRLQVAFSYQVGDYPAVPLPGVEVETVDLHRVVSLFELMVKVIRDEDGMRLQIAYDDSVLDEAAVAPLADGYLDLLAQAVAEPDAPAAALVRPTPPPAAADRPTGGAPLADPQVLLWSGGPAGSPPEGPVQQAIGDIWADLLQVDGLDAHTPMLDHGGHSLTLAKLAFRLRAEFAVEVSIADLFDRQTIAEQAELIEALLAERFATLDEARLGELFAAIDQNNSH